jgi:phage tail-like protein
MPVPRPFSLVRTEDQWRRAAHQGTSLQADTWAVQLAWESEPSGEAATGPAPSGAGLAFDPWCRLYRSVPEEGRVERLLWAADDPLAAADEQPAPVDLFATGSPSPGGGFVPAVPPPALHDPRGLAVDPDGRLFVAEAGKRRILVYDLEERRLLRRVPLVFPDHTPVRPLGLATDGRRVWAALDGVPFLAVLDARTGPRFQALPAGIDPPSRLAAASAQAAPLGPHPPDPPLPSPPQPPGEGGMATVNVRQEAGGGAPLPAEGGAMGEGSGVRALGGIQNTPSNSPLWLLTAAGTPAALIVPLAAPEEAFAVPGATDLAFAAPGELVVARLPGQDFLRFRIRPEGRDRMPQLKARGYDGRGIAVAPDGRIVFWTARGARAAVPARLRYEPSGRVITFRLDSGEFQTAWGRLFLDACIPQGTEIRVACATADEPPEETTLSRTSPANTDVMVIYRPDLSPPMPPLSFVPPPGADMLPLARRNGLPVAGSSEIPWVDAAADGPFETYDAPVLAPPGRYLWVTAELRGDTMRTPRLRCLRAERPGHDLLRRLPRTYSRDEAAADFLRRYLAPLDGSLADLDARATARRALLDPWSAPPELLSWLAGFVGLTLDNRWPLAARRRLIEEATWLFRFRGTLRGLSRFLEIYLEREIALIEHFRLRGPDGAHRFSVFIPLALSAEQESVVRHVLDVHRPAHTLYDLCTVTSGMRVGRGLYAGLTSIAGRSDGFQPLRLGAATLGRGTLLGRPASGTSPGASRVGTDSRVG